MTKSYSATANSADALDRELYGCGDYCVSGPGEGFGYYSWAHYPHRQFEDFKVAEIVAGMCESAYKAGFEAAQLEIRKALGL